MCDNEGTQTLNFIKNKFLYQLIRHPTRLNNILNLFITNEKNCIETISIGAHMGNNNDIIISFDMKAFFVLIIRKKPLPHFRLVNFD